MNPKIETALKNFVRHWRTYVHAWGMDVTKMKKLIDAGNDALSEPEAEEDAQARGLLGRFVDVCSRALNEKVLFKKEIKRLLEEAKELGF